MSSYATSGKSVSGANISLTIPNSGAYLIVFAYGNASGVTFDGVALTLLGSVTRTPGSYLKAYGLYDPVTGTHDVATSGTVDMATAIVFDACGEAQVAATYSSGGSSYQSISTSVSANETDMYVDSVITSYNAALFSNGAGQNTAQLQTNSGATYKQRMTYKISSVNTTMSYSGSVYLGWWHLVLRLKNYSPRLARGILIQ